MRLLVHLPNIIIHAYTNYIHPIGIHVCVPNLFGCSRLKFSSIRYHKKMSLSLSQSRCREINAKFPGKSMYCSKHNYGPMDTWYDCQECCDEANDEFEVFRNTAGYSIGSIPPSRRRLIKFIKMSTILKKIPRDTAQRWIVDCMQ